jgi:hypothetical protein
VFDVGEALLFRRGDELAVLYEAGGRVMKSCIDSQSIHKLNLVFYCWTYDTLFKDQATRWNISAFPAKEGACFVSGHILRLTVTLTELKITPGGLHPTSAGYRNRAGFCGAERRFLQRQL